VALTLVAAALVVVIDADSKRHEKVPVATKGPPETVRETAAEPSVLGGVIDADGQTPATSEQEAPCVEGMHWTDDKHQLQKGLEGKEQSPQVVGLEQL
jgi:hypothetical protein